MALITDNAKIAEGIYKMTLSGVPKGRAGQFLDVHMPDGSMLLPRPISLFDSGDGTATLVYRVNGRGTKLLSTMDDGELRVTGPLGNGFPEIPVNTSAVLIGGGLGVAPLALLTKTLRAADPARRITVYLGYSGAPFLTEEYAKYADVILDVGGYITEKVDFEQDAVFFACGPEPMMKAAYTKAAEHKKPLYISLERRMACGVGACFACSVETAHGMRRVCKDGPVFAADEVYPI